MSNSLWPHGLQHARPPCPSPTPEIHPNPCPLSRWCHPNISSSVIPFSCPQSFPASGSFQMSRFFPSGGQSVGVFSFNIKPSNEYSGLISFRMDWLDLLAVQGTLKSLFQHHSSKPSILLHSALLKLYYRGEKQITGCQGWGMVGERRLNVTIKGNFGGHPWWSGVKNPPANAGDSGSILSLEFSTCREATKPVHHNYRARAHSTEPELTLQSPSSLYRACALQQEKHHSKKPAYRNSRVAPAQPGSPQLQLEKASVQQPRPSASS